MANSAREDNYLLFSDESGFDGTNRYQAICAISGSRPTMRSLHRELGHLLSRYACHDIKFSKVTGNSKHTGCAKEFIALALRWCHQKCIRIEVMVWDMSDSRHSIRQRDDKENFRRMYFHCLKPAIKHWDHTYQWELYPDEHSAVDWPELAYYLRRSNLTDAESQSYLLLNEIQHRFAKIHPPKPSSSSKFHIIQLADLFAGMVRASHIEGEELIKWQEARDSKHSLFPTEYGLAINAAKEAKYVLMCHFKNTADKYKLGVNQSNSKYFKTFNYDKNIFLWKYEPQRYQDKAPIRKNKQQSGPS